ncbi:MAG: hypothetical protein KZQ58_10110 [gamma proteobacterium symbiont of Bathyaustriella thionipta]|nr:hypothetical protein [gamma proteobacterium symbiont of Bathyaustriella thionipta]
MTLGRQAFFSIQTALRKQAENVTANKTWLQLHAELAIGSRDGKSIRLCRNDRDQLRYFVMDTLGIDPLHQSIQGDRLDVAALTAHEKLSCEGVFANEIKIFRKQQPIELTHGQAQTPPGSYLSSAADNIDWSTIDTLVVVENGVPFRQWSKVRIDAPCLEESLTLYRGHDQSARAVMDLLEQKKNSIKTYAAVDFDPAGFRIALSLNVDGILIPEDHEKLLLEKHLNKPATFHKQNDKKCDALIPPGWRKLWEWLHARQIAITQESLLARDWPLVILKK